MQCGMACLQMICKYYGRDLSSEYLADLCHVTKEGVSMLGISDAASRLGITPVCVRIDVESLSKQKLPCIIHWNQNHFVVLYGVRKGEKFYVADPGKGLVRYSRLEFCQHWFGGASKESEGVAMFLTPSESFYSSGMSQTKETRSFRFLFSYIRQYRKYFSQIILGFFLGCVIQLLLPLLTQSIVDVGISSRDISFIWLVLIGQLVLIFSRTTVDFIRRWLLLHMSMRINISLVSDFIIKLLRLPMAFFDTKLMGDLMQRMNDHARVQSFLTSQTLSVFFSALSFLVFGIVLFFYNKTVFFVFLVSSILYAGWMSLFLKRRKIIDYEVFERQADNSNKTYQLITTMQEIKLQDCERRRRWEWEDVQADLFQVQMKSLRLQQSQEAGSIFINEIKNIIITVLSATAVIHGDMTLGMMLAVQYVIGQLNSPIEQLMGFIYVIQDVRISLERINEIHGKDNEEDDTHSVTTFTNKKEGIRFTDACFKYDFHSRNFTLDNISLHIPEGKVTAIVGASGSGKTTLMKLMLGYYPLNKGILTVGGNDIRDTSLKWWRNQCGVVMQDGVIFSESIARNIAASDGDIDWKRMEDAAEMACVKNYVMSLPLRFDTKIGREGVGLSQGQKQRILIARAIYRNPDYLFLDEATNSLDANNEHAIVEQLNGFFNGKTVVVVAHRLSTVRNADQIIVLSKGKIVECGTHNSLIAQKAVYYQLVCNQLELGN